MLSESNIRLLAIMTCILLAGSCLADITLVSDGVPKATIVVAVDVIGKEISGSSVEQPRPNKVAAAASDLQTYIEKISGAKLPIIGDNQPIPAGNLVLVGRSALSKDFDKRIPSGMTPTRDEEGYLILTHGNRLLLAGNDEPVYHGTEYAVAAFLHQLGVRWYMPGDYGEFVPRRTTITAGDFNIVSKPDFKMRNWWTSAIAPDLLLLENRWKIRNGMNPIIHFVTLPADSSVRNVLPPSEELNNTAYADVWGKTASGQPNEAMPNLSSEASVKYAADVIKKYFRDNPDTTSYGIGPDDGMPVDFTPETMSRNLGFPDIGGRVGVLSEIATTDEWMNWVQKVAKEVYKEFPDHIITTNGYANRNTPPVYLEPDPRIWIMFAAIWSDTMHAYDNPQSWQTKRQARMIEDWAKMYKNVYMYNYIYYMLAGCGAPIPLAHKTMHDMPLYKQWGVVGFSDEGRTVRGESGVFPTYLRARMMWNANLDAKTEMNEFFTNWYGPAAKPAKNFWEALENTFEMTPWLGHEDRILPYVYSQALIDRLEASMKEAEALAKDEPVKGHVLADRVTLEHLKAFMAMNQAEFKADFAEAARQAQRMVDVRKDATALSRFYFDPNPATGESYGFYYWGSVARRDYYQKVADATNGKTGNMITVLPLMAKCKLDPHDDGRFQSWSSSNYPDADWQNISTTMPFYRQITGGVDADGFPYMGALWYRQLVYVPDSAKGKQIFLYGAAIEPEAWVWVNGKFIGHRPYHDAYERPNELDMDITKAIVPGKTNRLVIRVHTGLNPAQMADGLVSRLFLYAPNDKPISAP